MLLVRGAYVWTGVDLLPEAGVLCAAGKVHTVGSWRDLVAAHPDIPVAGGPEALVLPGLVNAHHHGRGISAFMAGTPDDSLERWLVARRSEPAADPYLDTLWAATGLLAGGYATVVLFQSTRNPDGAAPEANARIRACRDVGLRVALGLDLRQRDWPGAGPQRLSTRAYLDVLEGLRQAWAGDEAVAVFPAPTGPQWVTDEAWEAIGTWSRQRDVPLHTHCLETPYQAEAGRLAAGGSWVTYLERLGALHARTALVHGVWLSDGDLDRMAAAGAALVTNPGCNLRLRSGVAPVLGALTRGITVALGTDGFTLGDADDAFAEMRLLLNLHRPPGMDRPALALEQVLYTATQGAAAVTPWPAQLGRLVPGSLADLTVVDYAAVSRPWIRSAVHPLSVLVQRAFSRHLLSVVVGGELVWDSQRGPLRVDPETAAAALHAYMVAAEGAAG